MAQRQERSAKELRGLRWECLGESEGNTANENAEDGKTPELERKPLRTSPPAKSLREDLSDVRDCLHRLVGPGETHDTLRELLQWKKEAPTPRQPRGEPGSPPSSPRHRDGTSDSRKQLSDLTNRIDHASNPSRLRDEVSLLRERMDDMSTRMDILSGNVFGDRDDIK